jgi:hypothetical protein
VNEPPIGGDWKPAAKIPSAFARDLDAISLCLSIGMLASPLIIIPLCGMTRGRFAQILRFGKKHLAQDDKLDKFSKIVRAISHN